MAQLEMFQIKKNKKNYKKNLYCYLLLTIAAPRSVKLSNRVQQNQKIKCNNKRDHNG